MTALLVALGKDVCKKGKPRCGECPVVEVCATGKDNAQERIEPTFDELSS